MTAQRKKAGGICAYPDGERLTAACPPDKPLELFYLIRADVDVRTELDHAARRAGGRLEFFVKTDRLFIGEGDLEWTHVALVSFSRASSLRKAAEQGGPYLPVAASVIYPFRRRMPPAVLQTVFGLARVVGKIVDTGDANLDDQPLDSARADLLPNAAQMRACAFDSAEKPAFYINFLSYRYRRAYMRYGLTAMLAVRAMGGRIVHAGTTGEPLTDDVAGPVSGMWDEIAIVRYPTPRTVLKLSRVPGYRSGMRHRDAGLERTALIVASEPS